MIDLFEHPTPQHNVTLGLPRDPIDLLHPLLYSDENYEFAKQAYSQLLVDLTPQPVSPQLERENLERIDAHRWIKHIDMSLYTQPLETLLDELRDKATNADSYICADERPIIALDLETTGLNKAVKLIGGHIHHFNTIVGVCLATSPTNGYYLPINHNQLDEVPNYPYEDIIKFLQQLVNEFHIIYHNAVFDQEVLALNGVRLANSSFHDTLLLSFLMGWRQDYKTLGLKFLAKTFLQRPMLEIHEIMGGKQSVVRMQTIPAKNAYVYGCCDAVNTYGLFDYITGDPNNPIQTQSFVTKLLHHSVGNTRSMFRVGLPVDYDYTLRTTKTLLRRMIMLENIYLAKISDPSISMTSAEQLGTYFYQQLKKQYEAKFSPNHPLMQGDKAYDVFVKKLKESFKMEVKAKQLKSQETRIVANCDEDVLNGLYNNLHTWDFVDPALADEIYILCEVLNEYRSLDNKAKIYIALVRNCFNDDLNLCRTPINLKLCGADTSRYSNGGSKEGAWDRIQVIPNLKGNRIDFIEGRGANEFNAQGLSHESGHWQTLKRIKNFKELSPKFKEVSQKLDKMVDSRMYELLLRGRVDP